MMRPMMPNVLPMKHVQDDIVSSAECSSDDEDLDECETSHAGGLGWFAFCLLSLCFHSSAPEDRRILTASHPHG